MEMKRNDNKIFLNSQWWSVKLTGKTLSGLCCICIGFWTQELPVPLILLSVEYFSYLTVLFSVCSLAITQVFVWFNSKYFPIFIELLYYYRETKEGKFSILLRAMHPPETDQNQGIMRTQKPNLTFPTFYLFSRQGGKPPGTLHL